MSDQKKFLEVFPTLKLNDDIKQTFQNVVVSHVITTKRKDILRIYISADRLIEKKYIYFIENQIKEQLFKSVPLKVIIYEQFKLSELYTCENLFKLYKDSILLEFKSSSPVMYSMLKRADVSFEDDEVIIKTDEIVPYREKAEEFVEYMEKIFVERCSVPAKIILEFKKAEKNPLREEDEMLMKRKIEEISNRIYQAQNENTEGVEETEAESATSEDKKTSANKDSQKENRKEAKKEKVVSESKESGQKDNSFEKKNRFESGERSRSYKPKKSDDPSIIWGAYDIEEDYSPISDIIGEIGTVVVRGKVLSLETQELKKRPLTIISMAITDFDDSIMVKFFAPNDDVPEILSKINLKKGAFVKIKGEAGYDNFIQELAISGRGLIIKSIPDFTTKRMDLSVNKRVELHCHTKMSDMDGVSDVVSIVKRAHEWGHPAIAITDHGVVQALADVFHDLSDIWKNDMKQIKENGGVPDKQKLFKLILGVEGYLVDDFLLPVDNDKNYSLEQDYVVFDIETTGFSPVKNKIIEIGAVKVQKGEITERYSTFVNPEEPIPYRITDLTSITDADVINAPKIETVLPEFLEFSKGCVMVAHNASFDMSFIRENCNRQGIKHDFTVVDTLGVARMLLPNQAKHTLDACCKTLKISLENHHRAVDDAGATAEIFVKFLPMLADKGVKTLSDINDLCSADKDAIKKLPSYHVIILAKNEVGRVNLYRLISESHLNYYYRRPKIPKSILQKYREGLIVGSACEAGELYRAMLDGKSDARLFEIASFYDYLEIQPIGNNAFMIEKEKIEAVQSEEDIIEMNRKIVELGEQLHKPVCATCDVHFLDPEDEVYRRIIMAGKGFEDSDEQAPLYLRTTEEMLEEFQYLGSDKAREVVITNPNLIADCCEVVEPVRPDKSPPIIPNSDEILTRICHNRAHEIYGEELPEIVEKRMEKELNSIIKNGFAVMYIISQKLVWKSVEDGYLVGSRGSVGSSFVAFLAGITEVNSLSPHYYCKKCHYNEFTSERVRAYSGKSGCDMPDADCPNCGERLVKDGFDIPFETFLGFKGDKEPDIDLNFSGEYQAKAHKYTEVIFGAGQTYRAGTVGTLADKTAFGYVKKYYEERGVPKRGCEINRIVSGCMGVRNTTGQHPGGIIVLPVGEDINSFTPIQHPANKDTDIVTTHFDYHKIDHNLLKLDILGHDDPSMIRMLQDLTDLDPTTIPLDDKGVMSLFQDTSALGVTPDDIGGVKLGSLGIPEFGTDFAMQMLIDTNPQSFTDLERIAGLAHGTDVWLGNAQTLIQEGKATISTCIATRDDIMIYLIDKGIEEGLSFKIMENVRKGKVAKGGVKEWPEWKQIMADHDVPDWYIWSCEQIKYMFPKAHAAAYVMMAWRVAYFKVNYPLAYYTAYFSIRASGFSYEIMCQGEGKIDATLADFQARMAAPKEQNKGLSKKEEDVYRDLRIVKEMYARGFEFMPINIHMAHSRLFQIVDGKIMPSFSSIDGMGDKAAESLMEAAKKGPFLSRQEICDRGKVSKTIVERMAAMNLLGNIPESNQFSLFDFM